MVNMYLLIYIIVAFATFFLFCLFVCLFIYLPEGGLDVKTYACVLKAIRVKPHDLATSDPDVLSLTLTVQRAVWVDRLLCAEIE